ncbi:MAG: hypothetical protein E6713_06485 [Sporomusaceae bacterium]|nr:hypothetical protein [Sporomusaceae bacterium]
MSGENNTRLDLGCIVGNLPVTVVTRLGTVYQGTILDWNCGRAYQDTTNDTLAADPNVSNDDLLPRRFEGSGSFIRLELTCRPGEICCAATPVTTPAIVNGIRSSVDNTYPLFEIGNTIILNWDDISAIGPQRDCLTG